MSGGERGVWPTDLEEGIKRATVDRTRNNAVDRIIKRIPLGDSFEVTLDLQKAVYEGVERIARLPEGVDHLYQVAIAFHRIPRLFAMLKANDEFVKEAERIGDRPLPKSVLDKYFERQIKLEPQIHEIIDLAFEEVIANPQDFPNNNVRDLIQEYLQTREVVRNRDPRQPFLRESS